MPRLIEAQRQEAIGMLRAMPVIDVANHFNCHRATIHKLKSRYQTTGHVGDLPRTGRPRVTTDAEDRRIRISHLRNRFKAASSTAREWQRNVSRQTISRRLKDYGLFCRRPAKKSRLTDRHRRTRHIKDDTHSSNGPMSLFQMSLLFQLKNVSKEKECISG